MLCILSGGEMLETENIALDFRYIIEGLPRYIELLAYTNYVFYTCMILESLKLDLRPT